MEKTKEELVNTCILITSKSQGDKVIEFYNSFGFNNLWKLNGDTLEKGVYYGNTKHSNPHCHAILKPNENIKIIKLPAKPRRKFPREMMVSNREGRWIRHTVLTKVNTPGYEGRYATRHPQYEGQIFLWKYGKEIE